MPTDHTLSVLPAASALGPIDDPRGFAECARGLTARMKDKRVGTEASHEPWDR